MKINFFKKIKKHPKGFTQAITSVSNFRLNRPFMPCLEHPEGFRSIYGPGLGPQDPKIKIFKKPPGIHPNYNIAKFQTDLMIYGFPRMLPWLG